MPHKVMGKGDFLLVLDFDNINDLRSLRGLVRSFNKYHVRDVHTPSLQTLTSGRYKALVYSMMTPTGNDWKIAFLFRVGRDRNAIWHTVIAVDYVLIDPSSRMTFTQVGSFVRIISQYVLKKLTKASCVDLLINLDNQLNPHVQHLLVDALKSEGMTMNESRTKCVKRLRDVDVQTGVDRVGLPLPDIDPSRVRGMMNLEVQSTVAPLESNDGSRVQFVSKIKHGSKQHRAILTFCLKHPDWVYPAMDKRTSYMETLFTNEPGDIPRWVDSLVEDAHFIVIVNSKGTIQSFMAFVAGYSLPSIATWSSNRRENLGEGYYIAADRTIFVPVVVCECNMHTSNKGTGRKGKPGIWSRTGFQQALALWKMLLTVLADPRNRRKFSMIAAQTSWGSLHANLLDALGFSVRARFSNLPYYAEDTALFARMIN